MKKKLFGAILVLAFMTVNGIAANSTYKVKELYAKSTELNGKIVSVKGKVIKISRAIMGKDWVHVQDDSTTAGKNDVIFTAKMDTPNIQVGDMVTASGTVKAKVDLGSGYFYDVLVENSTFLK